MKRKSLKYTVVILFFTYTAVMLYMMIFGRIGTASNDSYGKYIAGHISLIPFRFIPDYIKSIADEGIYNFRLRNIIGNTFLFIPLGIFLPYFFKKITGMKNLVLATASIIFVIECIQLFFVLGTFDIDDIILNCFGAVCGFFLCKKAQEIFSKH